MPAMILNMNGYFQFLSRFIESTKEPLRESCQSDDETVLTQQLILYRASVSMSVSRLQYLARCMELFSPRAVQNAVSKCITSGIPLPEVHRGVAGVCNQLEHSVHLRRDTAQCYVIGPSVVRSQVLLLRWWLLTLY